MECLIGAHTSAAGGPQNALLEGKSIGATTIQLFTSNQKRWEGKPLDQNTIDLWFDTLKETGIKEVMSHDSYLINLGAPDAENLRKSRIAFRQEAERCIALGITYLNFHPGAALKEDRQQCLDKIVESILELESLISDSSTTLLLEATAGQGSSVGCTFEELAYILERTKQKIPIGVCVDTCHIFVAGYDIRTPEAWDRTLNEFERIIGLKYLRAFHVNDSLKELGSRVDRHATLGNGKIGIDCFKFMMQDCRIKHIPKYLETPEGPAIWAKEIEQLRQFAKESEKCVLK